MRIRALGDVRLDDELVSTGKRQALLAALLVEANRLIGVGRLVERIWADEHRPTSPRRALQTQISLLRSALRPLDGVTIESHGRTGYLLRVDEEQVDFHRFRRLVKQATGAEPGLAVALYAEALDLWRGEPFEGSDLPWLAGLRASLNRERLACQLKLADLELDAGHHAGVLPLLTELAEANVLDEHLAGQLMLALYRSGRVGEALAHYGATRCRLREELGTDPSPTLAALHQRILNNEGCLAVPRPPVVVLQTAQTPRQLPAVPGVFTGRTAELAALDTAASTTDQGVPVVALVGAGGMGKTTLALHWAHRNLHRFPDGQLFVDLQGFSSTGRPVASQTAIGWLLDGLGVATTQRSDDIEAQSALLRSLLADRQMLIVLDNATNPSQILPLLPGSETCMVLVTSRDQLTALVCRRSARYLFVDPLPEADARALFAARLGSRAAGEPEATAELLNECAGMPLALSVLIARIQRRPHCSLAAIAQEIHDAGFDELDDFDPASSVQAMLASSYRTLSTDQARLFCLLGVTPGPDIALGAAAGLAGLEPGQARNVLRALEQRSLISVNHASRYQMHDVIRRYAVERARTDLPLSAAQIRASLPDQASNLV